MSKFRIARINELLRRAISEIFLTELDFIKVHGLVITNVESSKDLGFCKIYFTIPNADKSIIESMTANLNKMHGRITALVSKKVKLKYMPEFRFYFDDTLQKSLLIESLFRKIEDENHDTK